MPVDGFLLALGAALVHALWNLLLAGSKDPEAAAALAIPLAALGLAPAAALTWSVGARALPFALASAALQTTYFALLGAAYRRSDLSLVYPLTRGLAPVLVLAISVAALGASASVGEAAGVLLVGLGVVLVRGLRGPADAQGLLLAGLIAGCIAGFTLVDKEGIRYAGAVSYFEILLLGPALVYTPVMATRKGWSTLRREVRPRLLVVGLGLIGSYLLVLLALRVASAASVAAVRETSVVIATALAASVLGERVGRGRAFGSVLVAGGVALLALG